MGLIKCNLHGIQGRSTVSHAIKLAIDENCIISDVVFLTLKIDDIELGAYVSKREIYQLENELNSKADSSFCIFVESDEAADKFLNKTTTTCTKCVLEMMEKSKNQLAT